MLAEIPWYMDLGARGKKRWAECPRTIRDEVSHFLDHGYVVLSDTLPADLVLKARQEFSEHKERFSLDYLEHADEAGFQRRLVNFHMVLPSFRELFSLNQKALEIQDYLFGQKSCCFTSLIFESGSEQDIHRDSPYFTTNPEYYYLGVWVALEDVDELNGALQLYDRGHLLHEVDRIRIFERYYSFGDEINPIDQRLWDDYQNETIKLCDEIGLKKIVVPMKAGDTLIWHPHLPHGGSKIVERHRSRLSVVNHVIPEQVSVNGLDVFYGNKVPSDSPNYHMQLENGRNFLIHNEVSFAHADPKPVTHFT